MLPTSRLLLTAILASVSFLPLSAQVQLLKPQTIRFDGSQEYTVQELLAAVGVKKGQTYTADFFNQSAQKLMGLGVFEKVSFKFDGIELTYIVGDNPELYPVIIDNLPLDAARDPDAELRKRIPLYHGKVPSEGGMLDSVRQTFEAMLAEEGVNATVVAVPGGDPRRKATSMKFRIDAPPVKIGDIHLAGVSDELAGDVLKAVNLHVVQTCDARTAEHIEDAVANFYHDRGYAAAKVHATRAGAPVAATDAIRIPFSVQVNEDRVYQLGSVALAPSIPMTMDDVTKTMPPRDHFKQDSLYAEGVRSAVEIRLKAKGYLDCKVNMTPAVDESAGTVNYTIDAVPGPVYHLGLLKFENVSESMRALLMRTWQMMPGEPFNESYVSNFLFAAEKNDPVLQRSLIGVKATYDVHADPDTRDVNLVIRLERQ
jgi:outer membrane protein insertion porin family